MKKPKQPITEPVTPLTPKKPRFRLATSSDQHLPYYSHSIMEAILTCPKWGLIRYVERKYFKSNYRALALEAGSAMHDVFSAVRLWQVLRKQHLPDHFEYHGRRLYGEERFQACWTPKKNERDELLSFTFEILNSSEWYDDPSDRIRTIANMETTTIRYVDEQLAVMDRNPIWIEDNNDATKLIGIEIAFDMVIDETFRYIGTIDGIVRRLDNELRIDENKTASRLDETYRKAFMVKNQPTGYIVAASLFTGEVVEKFRVIGVKIKQQKSGEDYITFLEERDENAIAAWLNAVYFTHELRERFRGRPLEAPMFTHSCNRYFRPCGFVDLCAAHPDDQQIMYEEMETTQPSPSELAILEKYQ